MVGVDNYEGQCEWPWTIGVVAISERLAIGYLEIIIGTKSPFNCFIGSDLYTLVQLLYRTKLDTISIAY